MNHRQAMLILPFLACFAVGVPAQRADIRPPAVPEYLGPGMNPQEGRIGIDVTVTDAQGHAVSGLGQNDFRLLDDGQPVPLVSFAASTANGPAPGDPPVSLVLVLDDADLPAPNRPEAQEDLERFLRANGGRLAHPVTVYRVTTDTLYASNPDSSDGSALADVIASGMGMRQVWKLRPQLLSRGPVNEVGIRPEGFEPDLPQAAFQLGPIPTALKALGAITIEQRRLPGRKLLIWIGPGWRVDQHSIKGIFNAITEISTRMREARIELSVANRWQDREVKNFALTDSEISRYVNGIHMEQYPGLNLALEVLARRTGGEVLTTSDELIATAQPERNNIPRLIAEHVAQAGSYYRLTFDPPPTNTVDEYHPLTVELARPGLSAHTTVGYFNEPVIYDHPFPATGQISVAQLEQRLEAKQGDRELADELANLQLTERLSTPRLESWLKRMPGTRSRQALTALADAAVFLPPPADELLSLPAPDMAARQAMMGHVADYLKREVPRLPNFYAMRTTVQFGEPLPQKGETWKEVPRNRSLNYERTTAERIFFEDGKETTEQRKLKVKLAPLEESLETTGTFGPMLVLVLKAAVAPGGTITWSHWEKGQVGPVAVFDYVSSPKARSFYGVGFCCLAVDEGEIPFRWEATFRGELSIDPGTGHILRVTVKADLEPRLPLENSSIMVEYGPVVMGGETYFCPVRSVLLSRNRHVWQFDEWDMQFKAFGAYRTLLNDVTFDRYHLFRSETTILPGFVPVPQ